MALNPDRIPTSVLDDLLERVCFDRDKVAQMSVREAFDDYLTWHGIIGYTSNIIKALDNIRAAEIDPVKPKPDPAVQEAIGNVLQLLEVIDKKQFNVALDKIDLSDQAFKDSLVTLSNI